MSETTHDNGAYVKVPAALARRIRLALDHADRDAATQAANYQILAGDLVECEGYPIWQEPWSDAYERDAND